MRFTRLTDCPMRAAGGAGVRAYRTGDEAGRRSQRRDLASGRA